MKRYALALFVVLLPAAAAAQTDLVVSGTTVTLGGRKVYKSVKVVNGGTIRVTPYNGTDRKNTGNLELVAGSILVDATSKITADGSGYQPEICNDGRGPKTDSGGRGGCSVMDSGGGGAHFGRGGRGTRDNPTSFPAGFEENCGSKSGTSCKAVGGTCYNSDGLPSVAGVPYRHTIDEIEFGAAGGDQGCLDGDGWKCVTGGAGGGRVVLAAVTSGKTGTLEIQGRVTADGMRGCGYQNDSGGGGAGGTVLLVGDAVKVGAKARVSAAGGLGGDTQGHASCPSCAQSGGTCDDCGGGGGGGIVSIRSGTPATLSATANFNVSGAEGGTCSICKGEAGGGAGELQLSELYLGEVCDGYDNDFDGQIDEGLGNVSCGSGACQVTVSACNTSGTSGAVPNDCIPKSTPTCQPALSDTRGRFLVIVDTSGSMLTDLSGNTTFGDGSQNHPGLDTNGDGKQNDSRLYQAKEALTKVIAAYPEIDFALARFSQGVSKNLACPLAHWMECAGMCCTYDNPKNNSGGTPPGGACTLKAGAAGSFSVQPVSKGEECIHYAGTCGAPRRGADILVGFGKTLPQKLMWLDHKETAFFAVTTEGDHCAYSSGGDCELRGSGPTPLAGALHAAKAYLARERADDKIASCRPYAVILLTDGAETCQGSPKSAAAELLKLGIETYVVGFSVLSSEQAELNAIAAAGSTSGSRKAYFAGNEGQLAAALAGIVGDSIVFESCNGKDDDCDLLVDEDFANKGLPCDNGQLGECKRTGTYVCKADGSGLECSAAQVTPGKEVCDGKDNDCDGLVDEIAGCAPCVPQQEVCDGKDNDCDNQVDEGYAPVACGTGIGQCQQGKTACVSGQVVCQGGKGPEQEQCNNLDDNCDTVIDGFSEACFPVSSGCDLTTGVCKGVCAIGNKICTAGQFGACLGYQGPKSEVCNGLDDDCDGTTDEGVVNTCTDYKTCATYTTCAACPTKPWELCDNKDNDCDGTVDNNTLLEGTPCGTPVGECGKGKWVCQKGQLSCQGGKGPQSETCNAKDDDCNGKIDDSIPGLGSACGKNTGQCKPGVSACVAGKVTCLGGTGPTAEVCDCKDNDCDGVADNGASCAGGGKCVNCQCQSKCGSGEFPCPGGTRCKNGYCEPDACAKVVCKATERCQDGKCVSRCAGVTCGTYQKCDPNTGTCVDDSCYTKGCPSGQVCLGFACVDDPCPPGKCKSWEMCVGGACLSTCLGVTCPQGRTCVRGKCVVADPCDAKLCPGQHVCKVVGGSARCEPDPCAATSCGKGQVCHEGTCIEDPCVKATCPKDFACEVLRDGTADCVPLPGKSFPSTRNVLASGGGGCAVGSGGRGGAGWAVVVLLLLGLWRRRRTPSPGPRFRRRGGGR